ncbi:MAG: hypothetical protein ACRCX2_22245 [Paraclostridium sp.]
MEKKSLLQSGFDNIKKAVPVALQFASLVPTVGPIASGISSVSKGLGFADKLRNFFSSPTALARTADIFGTLSNMNANYQNRNMQREIMQQLLKNASGGDIGKQLEAVAPAIGGRGQVDTSQAKQSKLGEVLGSQKQVNNQTLMAILQLLQQQQQQSSGYINEVQQRATTQQAQESK